MILLKKIQLINFLSHEKTEINFKENERILIDGASGAGKSSIFDALIWCLYAQGRSENRSLINKRAKKAFVILELKRDEDTIIITRSVTSAGKHTVDIAIQSDDGAKTAIPVSGIRESQEWIDKELIGASYLLFINSVAYVQGNSESFVAQTAPKRKELLLEIVKAEDYRKYYEIARRTLQNLENDGNLIQGQLVALEGLVGPLEARIERKDMHIEEISVNTARLAEINPKMIELRDLIARRESAGHVVDTLSNSINTTKQEEIAIEKKLQVKRNKIKELGTLEDLYSNKSVVEKELVDIRKIKFLIDEKMATTPVSTQPDLQIARRKEFIETLKEKPICPSGDECPYFSQTTKAIETNQSEIEAFEIILEKEERAFRKWQEEMDELPDLELQKTKVFDREKKLRKMIMDIQEVESLNEEIPLLEEELSTKVIQISKLSKQKEEIEGGFDQEESNRINRDLHDVILQEKETNANITRAKAILESIAEGEIELKETKAKIATLKTKDLKTLQDKAKKVGLVKDAFGSKGIETLVIDYLLPKLEDRVNEVLARLSDFRVRLDTQRKSADGEGTVEGLFITILNEANEEMAFENYSGGEKLKISVAISEALATLQKVGFRLFDETFLSLDENSTESFVRVLAILQHNFDQILCISHLTPIKDMFEKKMIINKHHGISKIS